MRRRFCLIVVLLFGLNLTCLSLPQAQPEEPAQALKIKPAFGFEYFSRTINWDDKKYNSKLDAYFFTFNLEFEIQEGFSLGILLGYSLANYDGMIFRQLPFSLELGVGSIGGYLLGGEIKKTLISQANYEIGLAGQFVYLIGAKNNWEIPGLAAEGTAEGNPTWMRVSAGPVISYRGFDFFSPYLFLNFNRLWGNFEMEETVENLTGTEDKKFTGDGLFCISAGSIVELAKSFKLNGEVSLIPRENGTDLGFMFKASYSF
jgi:hypothetical protein